MWFSQFLRPKFIHLLDETQHQNIIASVRTLIQVLRSRSVALDSRHTPALYARFLSCQLARHNVLMDSDNDIDNAVRTEEIIPPYGVDCPQTLPNQFAWPDPENIQHHPVHFVPNSQPAVVLRQFEADMGFSVQHFMDCEPVHVNIAKKTNQDIAWCAEETGAWIHAPY